MRFVYSGADFSRSVLRSGLVNRTGLVGGPIQKEEGAHARTSIPRSCVNVRPDGLRPRPRASLAVGHGRFVAEK